jgi:hypothetical protein
MKNLVLGGVGSVTVVDGSKVEQSDMGNNFLCNFCAPHLFLFHFDKFPVKQWNSCSEYSVYVQWMQNAWGNQEQNLYVRSCKS